MTHRKRRIGLAALFVLGAALRLALAWRAPESVDLESYRIVADIERGGGALYESTHRYNYSPVWAWCIRGLDGIARLAGWPLASVMRTLLALVDLACALVVWLLSVGRGNPRPGLAAAFVLFNPVLIWVSSVQGQFDNVAVLLLLCALLADLRGGRAGEPAGPRLRTVAMVAASVAIKQVTAVHSLLWWRDPRGKRVALGALGFVAVLFLPYAGQWRGVRDHVLLYRTVPRSYGFAELVLMDARFAWPLAVLALAAGAITAIVFGRRDRARAALAVFLVLLILAPGLGSQYLVWPLVLGALWGGARYLLATGTGLLWILGSHYGVPGSGQFMGQLLWLSLVFWAVGEFRALSAPANDRETRARPDPPATGSSR